MTGIALASSETLNKKIAIALSGGVDSGVAGALLLEEGWDVIGVTLKLQAGPVHGCSNLDAMEDAAALARQLGIQHFAIDCANDFERLVLRPAWNEYAIGRTPSPCLWCNERIKFGILLDWASKNGCHALATGHYAKLGLDDGGQVCLLRSEDKNKDQTYFLAGLSQGQLSRIAFPLGGYSKQWVREKAEALGLQCAERKDSQDACYMLPGLSFPEALKARFDEANTQKCGHIVDWNGKCLATHDGIHNFTIGQRRGVGVGTGAKAWICGLDASSGNAYLTNDKNNLLSNEIFVSGLSWTSPEAIMLPLECSVQVRNRAVPLAAILHEASEGSAKVILKTPAKAAAPGQAAVFYNGDIVLGRGWINARPAYTKSRSTS
jgi:tRNA-specific 2-thiouridylase